MTIQIITTGGTIDKIYFDKKNKFQIGSPQISEVLKEVNATFEYEIHTLMKKDSLDLTEKDRNLIYKTIESSPHQQFIVTHGTDTMNKTAKMLKKIQNKTIILTGAMQPARFHTTDAIFNIGCAVTAVQILPPGIYIVMNGRIFDPEETKKNRELGIFEKK